MYIFLKQILRQKILDTCSNRKKAARESLMQVLGCHRLLSRWSGIAVEKMEARNLDIYVAKRKLSETRRKGNVLDM